MPTYLIKPDRDDDFYVMYSTVVDNIEAWGSRAELIADYQHEPNMVTADRFDRADSNGCSAQWGPQTPDVIYGFNDESITVRELHQLHTADSDTWCWDLPRTNIKAYCDAYGREDWEAVRALLTPIELDEDDA